MQVKKITKFLLASIALLSMGLVFAGGEDGQFEKAPPPVTTYSGVYLEGIVGYATRDWGRVLDLSNLTNTSVNNLRGGLTGGIDVGYQFNKYWGLEAGWLYLPQFELVVNGVRADKVESWFAYAALKLMLPVFDQAFLYVKGGLAYNYNKDRPSVRALSVINGINSNYWSPFAALGAQYYFSRNLSASFQAAYVSGRSASTPSTNKFATPVVYLYTASIGYKFMI